jgi:hypothetical protein
MKLGFKRIIKSDNLKIQVGTVDSHNPKAYYIIFSGWITANSLDNQKELVHALLKRFKYQIRAKAGYINPSNYLYNSVDINIGDFSWKQEVFFQIEITVMQKSSKTWFCKDHQLLTNINLFCRDFQETLTTFPGITINKKKTLKSKNACIAAL